MSALGRPNRLQRAVRRLNWICLLLATHGSLYPWRFAWPALGLRHAWEDLWTLPRLWTGLGDVLGNVALFVPIGLLMRLDLDSTRLPPRWRAWAVLVLGTLFAWLLQWAQVFLPDRDPELSDVVWNALGLVPGMALAALLQRWGLQRRSAGLQGDGLSIALVLLWLVLAWWPMTPTIDWQHVKDSLKPLLLHPVWHPLSALEAALGVLAVSQLLRRWGGALWLATALVALSLAGKPFIEGQEISASHAAGCAIGLLVAALATRMEPTRCALWLIGASFVWLTVDELRPFALADQPSAFEPVPFVALLRGSMLANTHALLSMVYWVGLLLTLALHVGARVRGLAILLSLWLLLLEAAQTWLPTRVAESTPALIPLLWLVLLQPLAPTSTAVVSRPVRRRSATR